MRKEIKVVFVERPGGPERLVCEAEIHFQTGPLAGLKLVGFSLWRSAEGEAFVSLPSRTFGSGEGRRYFDLLRPSGEDWEDASPTRKLKTFILREWKAATKAAAAADPLGGLV